MGREAKRLRINEFAQESPEVDVVDTAISPEEFWRRYISQRKPVILSGHPTDPEWQATQLWTDDYLIAAAGSAEVEVEHHGSAAEGFGRGRKRRMPFAAVVRALSAGGDPSLYLTTQEAPVGPDGHPEVLTPPVTRLAPDFPMRPALLGGLVPQAVNLWMGCSREGAPSGLHHDFHDNLYILLRGRKRFRLFPPSLAGAMYTYGSPVRIHPNGRVVYEGQGRVAADGSDAQEVAQWRAQRGAERELRAAEEAAARLQPGAEGRLAAAERALDAVLETALEGGFDSMRDDFDDGEGGGSSATAAKGRGAGAAAADPPSFSRVDLSLPPGELRSRFPLFPGVDASVECEVQAGQMLYLPAGWFHEVTSFSGLADCGAAREGPAGGSKAHLALNYWVHPPDNLDPSPAGHAVPYRSEYWPEVWAGRGERYEAQRSSLGQTLKLQRSSAAGGEAGDEGGRELSAAARARVLRGLRGSFGYGRRQHLHRFVGLRLSNTQR